MHQVEQDSNEHFFGGSFSYAIFHEYGFGENLFVIRSTLNLIERYAKMARFTKERIKWMIKIIAFRRIARKTFISVNQVK